MRITPRFLFRPTFVGMALHPAQNANKLTSLPEGESTYSQAEQFKRGSLDRQELDPSPLKQFSAWFSYAQSSSIAHPETVCLSTASLPSGRVSSRMVYLKELDKSGFIVYSNFGTSKKARDILSNPWASLTFWWEGLERQVRVEGKVERLSSEESQKYYDSRIRGSRIGAWASKQSQVLTGREELDGWVREIEERFDGVEKIPVPEFWGGLRVRPVEIEFWQGRESRLHDRFRYLKVDGNGIVSEDVEHDGQWKIERLSP